MANITLETAFDRAQALADSAYTVEKRKEELRKIIRDFSSFPRCIACIAKGHPWERGKLLYQKLDLDTRLIEKSAKIKELQILNGV